MTDTQAPSTALEFFATCPKGFEQLLAGELASLGTSPFSISVKSKPEE